MVPVVVPAGGPLGDERLLQAVHGRMLMDSDALGAVREGGGVRVRARVRARVKVRVPAGVWARLT